ncbi:hypothetical protein TI39_contig4157g00004 [Zymoseptoria brevis]|uniref:Uncharacterized protein n=1 Tax=Zymoseptoria brevis TaxID=1047168 RepID=A0A0F4GBQ1_9PEZI|nr:hypothetical protein TI39_contig4157g00004 [Zymoseptoria brevis]
MTTPRLLRSSNLKQTDKEHPQTSSIDHAVVTITQSLASNAIGILDTCYNNFRNLPEDLKGENLCDSIHQIFSRVDSDVTRVLNAYNEMVYLDQTGNKGKNTNCKLKWFSGSTKVKAEACQWKENFIPLRLFLLFGTKSRSQEFLGALKKAANAGHSLEDIWVYLVRSRLTDTPTEGFQPMDIKNFLSKNPSSLRLSAPSSNTKDTSGEAGNARERARSRSIETGRGLQASVQIDDHSSHLSEFESAPGTAEPDSVPVEEDGNLDPSQIFQPGSSLSAAFHETPPTTSKDFGVESFSQDHED